MRGFIATTALLLVTLLPVASFAQRENSLEEGAWALQFGIEGQFINVGSFAGGLSVKRHWSPKTAWRAGVSIQADAAEQSSSQSTVIRENDGSGATVSLIFQRYVNPDADANVYWGVGPTSTFSRVSSTARSDSLTQESSRRVLEVGAAGILGA